MLEQSYLERIEKRSPNYDRAQWERDRFTHLGYLVNISQYPEAYITALRQQGYDPISKRPLSAPDKKAAASNDQAKMGVNQGSSRPKTAPPGKQGASTRPSRPKTAFRRPTSKPVVALSDDGSVTGSVRFEGRDSVKSVRFDGQAEEDDQDKPGLAEDTEPILRATEAQADNVDVKGLDNVIDSYLDQVGGPENGISPVQERQLSSMALDIVQSVLSDSSTELELKNTDPLIQNGEVISEQVREMAWDVANVYLNSQNGSQEYLEGVKDEERRVIQEIASTEGQGKISGSASRIAELGHSPLADGIDMSEAAKTLSERLSSKQSSQKSLAKATSKRGSVVSKNSVSREKVESQTEITH